MALHPKGGSQVTPMNRLIDRVEYYFPDWRQRIKDAKYAVRKWRTKTMVELVKLISHFLAGWIGYALLLYGIGYFWFTFQSTQVGVAFSANHESGLILDVFNELQQNLLHLSFRLHLDALAACLLIGLISQVLAIRRYLYYGYGIINRICWFITVACLTALDIFMTNQPLSLAAGLFLYFLPVVFLLDACFSFSAQLLPELSIVLRVKQLKEIKKTASIRNQKPEVRSRKSE